VNISIFNVLGRRVRILIDGSMPAGRHRAVWDGTDENGQAVTSGVYFYRMEAGQYRASRKMVLIR
jgi:flagellar hook assembly protein FlgD